MHVIIYLNNFFNLFINFFCRSHCTCDDDLAKCLKQTNKSAANLMGNIYFNIIRFQCIADGKNGKQYQSARSY